MRLIIRDDSETASNYLADYIIRRINDASPTSTRPFVLGLPTGSSPLAIYRRLVERYKAGDVCRVRKIPHGGMCAANMEPSQITFENVVTFNMDEYIGLPRDHRECDRSARILITLAASPIDVVPI